MCFTTHTQKVKQKTFFRHTKAENIYQQQIRIIRNVKSFGKKENDTR